jgi:hypothetical protein
MDHSNLVDQLAQVLIGVAPDVLESVLDALNDGDIDLSGLGRDDLVNIVGAAVATAAGAASRQYLKQNPNELGAAIGRGLTKS